jgi:hypothetical protein
MPHGFDEGPQLTPWHGWEPTAHDASDPRFDIAGVVGSWPHSHQRVGGYSGVTPFLVVP